MAYELKREDIFGLAHSLNAEVREKGNELFFRYCPYCHGDGHDKDTFSINLQTGMFKCFRASCGRQGHFVQMARDFSYPLDFGDSRQRKTPYRVLPQREIEVRPPAVTYLESRHISREITERYQVTTRKDYPKILVFPFYDENNVLQFVKYRKTDFDPVRDKNKEWCERNTMPILFGMNHCENFGTLVITEGQIDSLSLAECGIKNAVSVPTGALGMTWLEHCWDWVTRFEEVIVFGDCENGKITLSDELGRRLPMPVRVTRPEDYFGEKDANAILCRFGKEAVVQAVQNAKLRPVQHVKELADVQAVDIYNMERVFTGITEIDRILGGLYFGQVILLTGKRGEGKSTFMSQLIVEALEQGYKTFAYSGELTDYHFKRWIDFQAAGPDCIVTNRDRFGEETYLITDQIVEQLNRWYRSKAYLYDNNAIESGDELESLLVTIEKAICRYGVRFICIDNLMTALDVDLKDDLYRAQSKFLRELKLLAVRHNVVVVLVAHPRKTKDGSFANDDVAGSADITNRVDVVLSYARSDDESCDSRLAITKNRLTGKLALKDKQIQLFYSNKSKRITSALSHSKTYSWQKQEPESPISALDLPF
jgi:archaellum biogenesis ATPase FlaH